ncbi:MAG TPA: methyltransferase domain-containing protein [Thermoanaerobaculia bacterium]|jgi:SAM-dependent methyltransferase
MPHPIPPEEPRSIEQLRQQYDVERELARRLHEASETRGMYSAVYDELLRRVPHHPAVAQKTDAATQAAVVALQLRLLEPFLAARPRYLEVGSGDCALAIELSRRLPRVIAIEAGSEILSGIDAAANVEIVVSDTPPYPLPDASVDLAFSSHVIEHLTPRDAMLHLRDIRRLLAPGGRYVCVTPNRLWGPHDVSRYFSDVPQGLHLREYTHNALLRLLRRAGFRRARVVARLGELDSLRSHLATRVVEGVLAVAPAAIRRRALEALSRGLHAPLRKFEQVIVVGDA